MAPRRSTTTVTPETDALDDAVAADLSRVGDELEALMETLGDYDQSSIKGMLYKVPERQGPFQWIRDIYPPFDVSDIMASLKEEFGGGNFQLRIRAGGKIRKVVELPILRDPTWKAPGQRRDGEGDMMREIFPMMMAQSERSKSDMMNFMQMQMQAQQAQQNLMMAQAQQQTQMMIGVMTAAMGGREKISDLIPAMIALRPPEQPRDSFGEVLDIADRARKLFGANPSERDENEDGPIMGAVSELAKLAGPALGAIREGLERSRAQQVQVTAVPPQPQGTPVVETPPGVTPLIGALTPDGGFAPADPVTVAGKFPVLDLIRDDLNVWFKHRAKRRADDCAEMLVDLLLDEDVTDDQVQSLVAAYIASPDPLGELAAEGIDLRGDQQWAYTLLSTLAASWNERKHERDDDDDDDTGGQAGGAGDAAANGGAGAAGEG